MQKYPIKFTGMKQSVNSTKCVGQFLLAGQAEFHTGRVVPVFLYSSVVISASDLGKLRLCSVKCEQAYNMLVDMASLPERTGYMYHIGRRYWKKKVRAVKNVVYIPYE